MEGSEKVSTRRWQLGLVWEVSIHKEIGTEGGKLVLRREGRSALMREYKFLSLTRSSERPPANETKI